MLSTLKKAFELIGPSRRRRFALISLLSVLVSGLEAVSALLVLALLQLVLEPGAVPEIPLLGDVGRWLPATSYSELVPWFAGVFAAFFVLRAGIFLFQRYAMARVVENTGVLLADRLVDGYLSMPYEFHLRRNSAELIRNAYDNVGQLVGAVFGPLADLFSDTVLVVAMLAVLLVASPSATVAVTALMGLTVWVTLGLVQPRLRAIGRVRQEAAGAALQHLQQGLGGLRDIKILGREDTFVRSFTRARTDMAQVQRSRSVLAYVPRVTIETVFLLAVLAVLVWATVRGSVEATLSTLGLFVYAGLRVQPSLQKIAQGLNSLRYAEAAVDDLSADLGLLDANRHRRHDTDGDPEPLPFRREITFERVSFHYPGAHVPAIHDVDLTIRCGESIGICGHTGGGKTTLLDLLCGLLLPSGGRITVDGADVAAHSRAWQRNIGVVHQSSFLIDDTLRRNIAFGVEDGAIDERALAQAVSVAQLDGFVASLPDGLGTLVGERGVRLSGGQRQRVTLARALYRRPRLLVLDEGTSALDNTTEGAILDGLDTVRGEVTLVMVAHRLSSIRHCDRIVFLEDGRISGIGTYEELERTNAAFRAMAV